MLLFEFFQQADDLYVSSEGGNWGRTVFYHLQEIRPDLARAVKGTDKDPFNIKSRDNRTEPQWKRFEEFITENWAIVYSGEND